MSETITKITEAMREQDAAPAKTYWQEIRLHAVDDPKADPAKLATARRELGKTAEEVEADLRMVADRFKLHEKLQGQADLEARLADLQKQRDKADAVLLAAETRHAETATPLDFEAGQARRKLREIETAESELRQRCPYPWLAEQRDELERDFTTAHREAARLKEAIQTMEANIEYMKRQARGEAPLGDGLQFELESAGPGGVALDQRTMDARRKLLDRANRRAEKLEPMREALAGQLAEAERIGKAQAALRRQMIEP